MDILDAIGSAQELYSIYTDLISVMEGLGIFSWILLLLSLLIPYFVMGYMLMCVGRKAKLESDWMPLIPVARQLYQMQIADCPWWYIFFFGCSTVTVASGGLVCGLIFMLTKKPVIIFVLLVIYAIANLVFTFLYYRKFYYYFGFNPNAAWVAVVPAFKFVSTTLTVLIAFSDAIHYRGVVGPAMEDVIPPKSVSANGVKKAIITGMTGKYQGATFDVTDGAEIVFGRAAAECNIIFDQYATDVSRRHCGIRFDRISDHYIVTDYSSNGTFLDNGSRMEKNQPESLPRGTVLYLGNRKNTFRLE